MPTVQQQRLQNALDAFVPLDRPIRVLEAGCGSLSLIRLPPDAHVTGIDISQRQLDRNQVLHEKILGDIQTFPVPEGAFDLIICWDVLEHVERPDFAITNLSRGLAEGGLLLLAMPNPFSVKGLLTRLTPHKFHLWAYHNIYGMPLAGVDGRGPFPTYLRFSMAPAEVERLAEASGLEVIHRSLTESMFQDRVRRKLRVDGRPWGAARHGFRLVTLGRLSLDETEVGMILRRPVHLTPREPGQGDRERALPLVADDAARRNGQHTDQHSDEETRQLVGSGMVPNGRHE
jgi:SAM-dependent methyltransferase